MSFVTGQSIGRYQIIDQLGEGGMATVYKAVDKDLERNVAIKVIRREALGKAQFYARFEREAKALARLSHPHIVHILDYGEQDGMPYLVMEYIPGGTLKQKLVKPLPCAEAARLLVPIARALEYAHQHKVVHRDVKPANILINEAGQPMLSDFGISKILEEGGVTALTTMGVGIGTPEYMAPEQGRGLEVSYSSDIYALGVVFYELVTGRRPFRADTPMAVVLKHATEPLPSPRSFVEDIPESVERILLKVLAKRPEDRYDNMGAFAQVLEQVAEMGEVKGIPLTSPAKKVSSAIPSWAIAAGAVVVLGLGTIICISLGTAGVLGLGKGLFGGTRTVDSGTVIADETSIPGVTTAAASVIAQPTSAPTLAPRGSEALTINNVDKVTLLGKFFGKQGGHYVYSPDGRFLAGGSSQIYLYDANMLAEIRSFDIGSNTGLVAFSPDGNLLATSQSNTNLVQIWQTEDGKLLRVLEGHTQQILSLEFSPDGSMIATSAMDMICLWQVSSGIQIYSLPAPQVGAPRLAFSPDGSLLAVSGYDNLVIRILRVTDGALVRELTGSWETATFLTFSPDGKLLAGATGRPAVWQVDSGTLLYYLEDAAPSVNYVLIDTLVFSLDGSLLVTGGGDTVIRFWNPADGALLRTLDGNKAMISEVSFTPDGNNLVVEATEMLTFGIP